MCYDLNKLLNSKLKNIYHNLPQFTTLLINFYKRRNTSTKCTLFVGIHWEVNDLQSGRRY